MWKTNTRLRDWEALFWVWLWWYFQRQWDHEGLVLMSGFIPWRSHNKIALLAGSKRYEAKLVEVNHWGVLGDIYVCHTGVFRYASLYFPPTKKQRTTFTTHSRHHDFLPQYMRPREDPGFQKTEPCEPKQILPLLFLSGILAAMQKQLRAIVKVGVSQVWRIIGCVPLIQACALQETNSIHLSLFLW